MKLREQLHKSFRSAGTTSECWAQDMCGAHSDPSEWQMWDRWPTEPRRVCSAGDDTDLSCSTSVRMLLLCRVKSAMTKTLSVC